MTDLLTVRNLAVEFALEGGAIQAVRGAFATVVPAMDCCTQVPLAAAAGP